MDTQVAEQPQTQEPPVSEEPERSPLLEGQNVGETESPAEEVAEAPAVPQVTVASLAQQLGFQDVRDDGEASQRLSAAYEQSQSQIQQIQQERDQLNATLQALISQQPQQVEQPQATSEQSGWWNPPDIDPELVKKYKTQEGWDPNTPPEIRAKGEQLERYVDNWVNKLMYSPQEALEGALNEIFERKFDETYGSRIQEQKNEQALNNILRQNSHWMFEQDPVTKQPRMVNGQYVLTQQGQVASALSSQAEQAGMTDPVHIWNYVQMGMTAQSAAAQQAQQPATQDHRLDHLRQAATNVPQRSGTEEPVTQELSGSNNPNLSAGQKLAQQLLQDGYADAL